MSLLPPTFPQRFTELNMLAGGVATILVPLFVGIHVLNARNTNPRAKATTANLPQSPSEPRTAETPQPKTTMLLGVSDVAALEKHLKDETTHYILPISKETPKALISCALGYSNVFFQVSCKDIEELNAIVSPVSDGKTEEDESLGAALPPTTSKIPPRIYSLTINTLDDSPSGELMESFTALKDLTIRQLNAGELFSFSRLNTLRSFTCSSLIDRTQLTVSHCAKLTQISLEPFKNNKVTLLHCPELTTLNLYAYHEGFELYAPFGCPKFSLNIGRIHYPVQFFPNYFKLLKSFTYKSLQPEANTSAFRLKLFAITQLIKFNTTYEQSLTLEDLSQFLGLIKYILAIESFLALTAYYCALYDQ